MTRKPIRRRSKLVYLSFSLLLATAATIMTHLDSERTVFTVPVLTAFSVLVSAQAWARLRRDGDPDGAWLSQFAAYHAFAVLGYWMHLTGVPLIYQGFGGGLTTLLVFVGGAKFVVAAWAALAGLRGSAARDWHYPLRVVTVGMFAQWLLSAPLTVLVRWFG